MKSLRSTPRRRSAASLAVACATVTLVAGCASDSESSDSLPAATTDSTTAQSETSATDPVVSAETTVAADDAEATTTATETPDPAVATEDTTYLDLYTDEGIVYDPFYGDALGGDINYVEAPCAEAVTDLASFGAALGDVDAAGVLASLQAVNSEVPANFAPALQAWEQFIADYSDAYSGPFLPVSQGDRSDDTLRRVLVDPDVVAMLDAYTSLELRPPNDFLAFLDDSCTSVEIGTDPTTTG